MKLVFILVISLIGCLAPYPVLATSVDSIRDYRNAYDEISKLIEQNEPNTFKQAVMFAENAYMHGLVNKEEMNRAFELLGALALNWSRSNHILDYEAPDSIQMLLNRAVFQVIKDTIKVNVNGEIIAFLPYEYNFDDYNGKQDWANTFVATLLATHKGNCHSLPYLYKIIADETGAKCWLALAPNHMYIKNRSVRDGWFNTELTSGEFPIDAWLTTTGYIPLKAIQTGLYCDTLGNQQSIALCILDLAKAYEKETKNYYDGFILQCCDLVLKYHSTNVQALLLKAETLKRVYQQQTKEGKSEAKNTYSSMEGLYVHLYDMGYREMPDKMYREWLLSLKNQKDKYSNRKVFK